MEALVVTVTFQVLMHRWSLRTRIWSIDCCWSSCAPCYALNFACVLNCNCVFKLGFHIILQLGLKLDIRKQAMSVCFSFILLYNFMHHLYKFLHLFNLLCFIIGFVIENQATVLASGYGIFQPHRTFSIQVIFQCFIVVFKFVTFGEEDNDKVQNFCSEQSFEWFEQWSFLLKIESSLRKLK